MLQLTTHDQIRIEKVCRQSHNLQSTQVTHLPGLLLQQPLVDRGCDPTQDLNRGHAPKNRLVQSKLKRRVLCNGRFHRRMDDCIFLRSCPTMQSFPPLAHFPRSTLHRCGKQPSLHQHTTIPLTPPPPQFVRWQAISAIDILTEILLLASAIYFLWAIQTSLSRKAIILTGFAFRLPIIIAIAFRLATYSRHGLTTDPSLREAEFIAWTQTELNYSIISATIPGLLQFMRNLNTQFGGLTEQENVTYGKSSGKGGSKSRSFPMSVLRSNRSNNASHNARHGMSQNDDGYEEGNGVYGAHGPPYGNRGTNNGQPPAMGVRKDNPSMGSTDSQRMIIQKSVSYDVNYE